MAMEATATVERAGSGATCQTDPAPDMAASAQQEAVALLEAVCQTGDAASLEALRELVKQDEAAQLTASKVVQALGGGTNAAEGGACQDRVQGCRMVRALCLAGAVAHLEAAGVYALLLDVLTAQDLGAALQAAAAEALVSCAVRSRGAAAAVAAAPTEQLKQVIAILTLPAQPAAAAGSSPDAAAAATLPLLQSMLRLLGKLLQSAQALPALIAAGVLPALARVLASAPALTVPTNEGKPTTGGDSSPDSAARDTATAQTSSVRYKSLLSVYTSLLAILLSLSQYEQLHNHFAAAQLHTQLLRLLDSSQPAALLEPVTAALANLANGSSACQRALVAGGAVAQLVPLLSSQHVQVACSAVDALANLMLSQPAAQRQLLAARCSWPGTPAAVGKQQAAGQPQPASAATPTSGVAALVRLLRSTHWVLVCKVLRCLSNAVLSCAANQSAVMSLGAMPIIVRFTACGVAPLQRQAVGLLTNLLPGCKAAQVAALNAGLPAITAQLLTKQQAPTPTQLTQPTDSQSQPANADLPAAATGGAASVAEPVAVTAGMAPGSVPTGPIDSTDTDRDELITRTCLLVANLSAAGPAAKTALLQANVLPPLISIMAQAADAAPAASGGAAGRARVSAAAASAVSNLALHSPELATEALRLGVVDTIVRVMTTPNQDPEVLSRSLHALGSLSLHNTNAKTAVLSSGAVEAIRQLLADSVSSNTNSTGSGSGAGAGADSGAQGADKAAGRVSVCAACCRALGHLAMGSAETQSRLTDVVTDLLQLIQGTQEDEISRAALTALANITLGCTTAQMKLLSTPGAVEQLAKATTAHPATEHALCACVYALVCPPHTPHAAPAGADGAGAGAAAVVGALPDIEWEAGCAAVHQGQEVLAEAGMLPRLIKMLASPNADVVDGAAMALCALISGNRNVQKRTAAEGGVAALAQLLDRLSSFPQARPALTRHAVDAWLELGGATAAVKLIGSTQPVVVECACKRIASAVLTLAGRVPATGAAEAAAQARALQASGWLVGGVAAAAPGPAAGAQAVAALLKAGAPAALVQACKRPAQPKVLLSALVAVRALLEVGGSDVRAALVKAGAPHSLQSLQVAAVQAAANANKQYTRPSSANAGLPPTHPRTKTTTTNHLTSTATGTLRSSVSIPTGTSPGRQSMLPPGVPRPKSGTPVLGSPLMSAAQSGASGLKPGVGGRAQGGLGALRQGTVTPLHVAQLCEHLCAQLLTS